MAEVLYSSLLGAITGGVFEGALPAAKGTVHMVGETVRGFSGNDAVTKYMTEKILANREAKYDFGVKQSDIDEYVRKSASKENTEDHKKYAYASESLIGDVSSEIDINGYVHVLRDNDIRHIINSHGEKTNEKYPVTLQDIAQIPNIIENYDKVYVKTNANGKPGIVYVKVGADNVVYYVEAVTTEYHGEKMLVNKQMIKAGIDSIPNLHGLEASINKKESSSQYLADLQEIRKAYVQDVKENSSDTIIPQNSEVVNSDSSTAPQNAFDDANLYDNRYTEDSGYMFGDTEGILDDSEIEAMFAYEAEDADNANSEVVDDEVHINTPQDYFEETGRVKLETVEAESRRRRAQAAKTDTAKSGIMEGVSEKDIRIAELLSKVFGRKILFISAGYRVNGKTENGIIYVNAKKGSIISQILAHELTHTAEGAKQYAKLRQAVINLYAHQQKNWNAAVNEMLNDKTYIEHYAAQKRKFERADAERELVARAVEEILGSDQKLTEFAENNRNIATRWFARLRNRLRAFSKDGYYKTVTDPDGNVSKVRMDGDELGALQLIHEIEQRLAKALRATKRQSQHQSAERFMLNSKERGGYNAFREMLAKESLDDLSAKLGDKFPLSANFDEVMRADDTPLVMTTVEKGSEAIPQNKSLYSVGKDVFYKEYKTKTDVKIQQMGITATLPIDVVRESISKDINRHNKQLYMDLIPHLSEILEHSVLMGIERTAHTSNKGPVLYEYRLYNLYNYSEKVTDTKTGKQTEIKSPHCLVCTVSQYMDNAEGWVFRDIENVTAGQVTPNGNKTTVSPTSSHGNTYSISQLYDFVKRVKRENGGLKYNESEKLKYLFNYTERNDGTHYSLATDEQLRNQAIKMLQDGINAKQVFDETGYFIDDKGRLRNDIEDTDGSDPAIRKPYPISRPSEALAETREKLQTEREQHKKELAYNREYWQAENRKVKEKIYHEYAERDAKRNMQKEEEKRKKRAERERRKRARGGYIRNIYIFFC